MEKASHEGVVVRGPSPSRQVVDRVVSEPLGISSVRFEGQISTFRTACSSSERVVGAFLNITGLKGCRLLVSIWRARVTKCAAMLGRSHAIKIFLALKPMAPLLRNTKGNLVKEGTIKLDRPLNKPHNSKELSPRHHEERKLLFIKIQRTAVPIATSSWA